MMIIFVVDSVRYTKKVEIEFFGKILGWCILFVVLCAKSSGRFDGSVEMQRRAYTQYSPVGSKPIVAAAVKKIFKNFKKKKTFFL